MSWKKTKQKPNNPKKPPPVLGICGNVLHHLRPTGNFLPAKKICECLSENVQHVPVMPSVKYFHSCCACSLAGLEGGWERNS